MNRDAFASLVTHELRNPLNAMSGWLHLLAADPVIVGEAAQRAIGGLRRALEQQVAQVDVLGRVLRLDEGADPIESTRVDLGVMLASCADTLRPLAQAGGRTVEVEHDGPGSVWVNGNDVSIAAALRTLGVYGLRHGMPGSALNFTLGGEPGEPSVRVSIDEGEGDGLSVWHGFGGDGTRLTLELLHVRLMLQALGATLGPSGRGRVGDALVIRFAPPDAEAPRGPPTDRPHD
jgi:signal transduction histidine kinase